jgi:cobalt/nickel transport system permease protein/cobalt/nickel transport protein
MAGDRSTRKPGVDRRNVLLFIVGGLIVALGLAFFVSPFASSSPDGLNKVAAEEGFSDAEGEHATAEGPLAGYGVEGVDDDSLSTSLAGIIGVAITFGVAMILFGLIRSRRPTAEGASPAT